VQLDLTPWLDVATPLLFGAFLILTRLSTLILWLPGLAAGSVPVRIRIGVALLFAVAIDMGLGGVHVPIPDGPISLVLLVAREILMGAGMGMAIRLLITTMEVAGSLAGITMGLSMNVFVDPASGDQSLSLGALLGVCAALVFVTLDGHRMVMLTLIEHLQHFPPGQMVLQIPDARTIAELGTKMIETALQLSAPVIVTVLCINIGLAFVARTVPSANIFAIGLGAMILGGLLALATQGDAVVILIERGLQDLPQDMVRLSGTGLTGEGL
jgi:flagellar biosynthetic protein FliR